MHFLMRTVFKCQRGPQDPTSWNRCWRSCRGSTCSLCALRCCCLRSQRRRCCGRIGLAIAPSCNFSSSDPQPSSDHVPLGALVLSLRTAFLREDSIDRVEFHLQKEHKMKHTTRKNAPLIWWLHLFINLVSSHWRSSYPSVPARTLTWKERSLISRGIACEASVEYEETMPSVTTVLSRETRNKTSPQAWTYRKRNEAEQRTKQPRWWSDVLRYVIT